MNALARLAESSSIGNLEVWELKTGETSVGEASPNKVFVDGHFEIDINGTRDLKFKTMMMMMMMMMMMKIN